MSGATTPACSGAPLGLHTGVRSCKPSRRTQGLNVARCLQAPAAQGALLVPRLSKDERSASPTAARI